jgi:hypothetical protein
MHEYAANANGIGGVQNALGAVAEERAAKAQTFVAVVDGQPTKDDDRDRLGHVATEAARRRGYFDATRSEGKVSDNFRAFAGDKGAGGVRRLIFGGAAFQPIIEGRNAGREFSDLVMIGKRLGSGDRHASSHGAGVRMV